MQYRLSERWRPGAYRNARGEYGQYRLRIERLVADRSEYLTAHAEMVDLSSTIERLWAFATGAALRSLGFGFTVQPVKPLPEWRSNATRVDRKLQERSSPYVIIDRSRSIHCRGAATFPLHPLLAALAAHEEADDLTRTLIDLHYHAVMSPTPGGREFLLCKALEIVRAVLPGKDDQAKGRALPQELRDRMIGSFHALFGLANTRFETRHAVARKSGTKLHPRMSREEGTQLLFDGDAVVRSVVCSRLGIEYVGITRPAA